MHLAWLLKVVSTKPEGYARESDAEEAAEGEGQDQDLLDARNPFAEEKKQARLTHARLVVRWFCSFNQINAEVARLLALMQEGGLHVLTVHCLVFAFISAFDVFI